MTVCPQCDTAIDVSRSSPEAANCPHCGQRLTNGFGNDTWLSVARVANLAEAGFITDELIGRGIDARVHQLDEFNAATDRWAAQYLIRVPSESAQPAAEHIRQYLTEEPPARPTVLDAFRLTLGGSANDPGSWRPVIAVLLVGVASFALGQRFSAAPPPRRPARSDLAMTIAGIGRSFSTAPTANQPRYRLSFDPHEQQWTLDADRDNDGVFDQSQQFNAIGAAR